MPKKIADRIFQFIFKKKQQIRQTASQTPLMNIFPSREQFQSNSAADSLLKLLQHHETTLSLKDAVIYNSFPLYRDEEGGLILADCVLLSKHHGVVAFALTTDVNSLSKNELSRCIEVADQVPSYIHSRLIKSRPLKATPTQLKFDVTPLLYGPFLDANKIPHDLPLVTNSTIIETFSDIALETPLTTDIFDELTGTIEGAKGLIRPKKRDLPEKVGLTRGKQAELIEASISLFDQQQKHGMMGRVNGPQRIRGLAGSGKTVVLAMKAAQTHLRHPSARIVYTFWTKSLYQHVKRLITRFYRQFDDKDPDWNKLQILHGWGSASTPGLYSVACEETQISPLSFQQAGELANGDRFDYACKQLIKSKPKAMFDYVMVDEGQDFPLSFIRLCHKLSKAGKFVYAYDDLQTIFQTETPSTAEIFGTDENGEALASFEEDVVLYKCYRNPREILVTAHALGFGIYGEIVQMLESPDHWDDIGYKPKERTFEAGSKIRIERPAENSLTTISDLCKFQDIIQCKVFDSIEDEVNYIVDDIATNLDDGLLPDDILVVCVDDRSAKNYLARIEKALYKKEVSSNNLHSDSFGIRDFTKDGRVTLSTVHKAKGNESFMVYVAGVDALMTKPDVRKRNMLFTAMTRAKGWVRVSGIGAGASACESEIKKAEAKFPFLEFIYPDPEQLKVMRRDIEQATDKRQKARRYLEKLQEDYSDEEITEMLQRAAQERRSRRND